LALASSRAALVSTPAPKRLALVALLLGCWNPRALPLLKNSEAVKEERPENDEQKGLRPKTQRKNELNQNGLQPNFAQAITRGLVSILRKIITQFLL
jgi:hypothetical protein